jgi:hypothetical protein
VLEPIVVTPVAKRLHMNFRFINEQFAPLFKDAVSLAGTPSEFSLWTDDPFVQTVARCLASL